MCSIIPSDSQMFFKNISESLPRGVEFPLVLKEQDDREALIQSRTDSTNPAFTEESIIQELASKVTKISSPSAFLFSSACTGYGISNVIEKTLMKFPEVPTHIYVGMHRTWILNPALETIMFVRSAVPHVFITGVAFGLTCCLFNELRTSQPPEFYNAFAKGTGVGEKRMLRLQKKVELLSGLAQAEENPAMKQYYKNCFEKMKKIFSDVEEKRLLQSNVYQPRRFFFKQRYVFTPTEITLNGSRLTYSVLK